MNDIVLRLHKVTKTYGGNGNVPLVEIFKGLDFNVKRNEVVGLFSPSGSGKTTFLQIAGLLDSKCSGDIYINGSKVNAKNDFQTSMIRRKNIGFVFQFHHLLPEFTALENTCLPGYIAKKHKKDSIERAKFLLHTLGLNKRINHRPSELSGGDQQRVSIARALMNEPKVILADEPSGNLDTKTADEIHNLFFKLREELGLTFVIVTHNIKLAELADRKIVMKDGLIIPN